MANVNAFMEMVNEFVDELSKTFPEEPIIAEKASEYKQFNAKKTKVFFQKFTEDMKIVGHHITQKNDICFDQGTCEFFDELCLYKVWKIDVDSTTKDAIWQYLNTLYILSTTISAIPPELMNTIEAMAQQCAQKMENDGMDLSSNNLDIGSLMAGMQNIIGNMPLENLGKK